MRQRPLRRGRARAPARQARLPQPDPRPGHAGGHQAVAHVSPPASCSASASTPSPRSACWSSPAARSPRACPWWAVLTLPVLFAAGMSLLDTLDGAFMNVAYGWAFARPVRKIYYNITVTALSVAVALIIGGIELVGLLAEQGRHHHRPRRRDRRRRPRARRLRHRRALRGHLGASRSAIWKVGRIDERWSAHLEPPVAHLGALRRGGQARRALRARDPQGTPGPGPQRVGRDPGSSASLRTGRLPAKTAVPTIVIPVLLAGLLGSALVSGTAAGASPRAGGPAPHIPTLVGIRAAHHPGFDRVVFAVPTAGCRPSHRVPYVAAAASPSLRAAACRIAGRAFLRVRFDARQHPRRRAGSDGPGTPGLRAAERDHHRPGRRLRGRHDVRHRSREADPLPRVHADPPGPGRHRRARRRSAPSQRPGLVLRPGRVPGEPRAVLRAAAAPGARRQPRPSGCWTGSSPGRWSASTPTACGCCAPRATGFTGLSIADRVARVRLTGGCSSAGPRSPWPGEIMPTLRQFPSVDWVKIYDPAGRTEHPTGHTDSIPDVPRALTGPAARRYATAETSRPGRLATPWTADPSRCSRLTR